MPGRDGTGPVGSGPFSGRGMGLCRTASGVRYGSGLGLGCRRGYGGRYYTYGPSVSYKTRAEFLSQQKEILKDRIVCIDRELDSLSDTDK
jgi:hypothetical protein